MTTVDANGVALGIETFVLVSLAILGVAIAARTSGNDSTASVTGPASLTTGSSAKSLPDPPQRDDHGATPSPQRAPARREPPP